MQRLKFWHISLLLIVQLFVMGWTVRGQQAELSDRILILESTRPTREKIQETLDKIETKVDLILGRLGGGP